MIAYEEYDAVGLAELVRVGEVTPIELLDAAMERVERLNPRVNAVVVRMYEQARAAIKAGLPQGPLCGVPFLLKDLRAQYAGVPTSAGSRLWKDWVATRDSELVRRHKRAGLVIFGKTNTSEFGCSPSTEGALFGATRNPWNPEVSAGGSSGGSAAAVALGMVPAAHGSDGGGSIRIPASCCGVFGFKPSRAVNSSAPAAEAWSGLGCEHALTRTVRDSAVLLDATRGPAPGDPYSGPAFPAAFSIEIDREPRVLRIGVQRQASSGAVVHPDCIAAVDSAARLLSELKHQVEYASPRFDVARVASAYPLVVAANVRAALDHYAETTGEALNPERIEYVSRIIMDMGAGSNAADMVRASAALHAVGREVATFFQDFDVLLTPVVATPPPLLGVITTDTKDVQAFLRGVFDFTPFTALANIAGAPAMSVPMHWNADGLPIGVHFMAGYGKDAELFRLASQLERASAWRHRRPPI